jgi:xanthine dehydrogenase accessory factor
MNRRIIEYLQKLQNTPDTPVIMVLVVDTEGSAPQIPGSRMLVSAKGRIHGTVGGGTIEMMAIDHAVSMLENDQSTDFFSYDMNLSTEKGISTGMQCGGTISIYYERLAVPEKVIIYGCGHIGGTLIPIAAGCGFSVTGIDHRSEMASPKRFSTNDYSGSIELVCQNPVEHAGQLIMNHSDSIVIMTHNHRYDADVLHALISTINQNEMPRYLGMIGSASKVKSVLGTLGKQGVSESVLKRVRTPIGLKTGGASPVEIAISIISEVLAVKYETLQDGYLPSMSGL